MRAPTIYIGATMPKYLIERELPGAGALSDAELQEISRKSCNVLHALGPDIQWVQSFVTDDKIYCIYIAADEQIILEHARSGGFPANRVAEIRAGIDPVTAEGGSIARSPMVAAARSP